MSTIKSPSRAPQGDTATRSIGDPEGGPPGYTIGYLHGEDLALAYRATEEDGPVVLVTHPRERLLATGPRHIISGPERVVVRAWSAARVCAVRYSIDDGPWADLELSDDGHWQGRLPNEGLTKGVHSVAVVAVDADGIGGSQRIVFMVDPTGRYTAIPQVSPMVSDTQFC